MECLATIGRGRPVHEGLSLTLLNARRPALQILDIRDAKLGYQIRVLFPFRHRRVTRRRNSTARLSVNPISLPRLRRCGPELVFFRDNKDASAPRKTPWSDQAGPNAEKRTGLEPELVPASFMTSREAAPILRIA
jgi:hypothetical protein